MKRFDSLPIQCKHILPHIASFSSDADMQDCISKNGHDFAHLVRNILDKVGEDTFSDAQQVIRDYLLTCKDESNFSQLYCKNFNALTIIDTVHQTMSTDIFATFLNMVDETRSLQIPCTWGDFDIVSYKINNQHASPKYREGNVDVYEIVYDPPIPMYESFSRKTTTVRSMKDCALKDSSYWIDICFPTRFLDLKVQFCGPKIPKSIFHQVRSREGKNKFGGTLFEQVSTDTFRLTAAQPAIGHQYCISWNW